MTQKKQPQQQDELMIQQRMSVPASAERDGAAEYRAMLASPEGWPYILDYQENLHDQIRTSTMAAR